jgi:hypothetical protein
MAEYRGCPPDRLADPAALERLLRAGAAAAGGAVRSCRFDQQPDGTVAGVLLLDDACFCLRAVPHAAYSAGDFAGQGARAAHAVISEGLGAARHALIEVVHGDSALGVRGHRPVEEITLDCRAATLPPTVRVGRSPGRGLGLFATRAFAPGEVIYESPSWLTSHDTILHLDTEVGRSTMGPESFAVQLTLGLIEGFPAAFQDSLCAHYDLAPGALVELKWRLSEGGELDAFVTGFDSLVNHSSDPNIEYRWDSWSEHGEGEIVFLEHIVALRAVEAGDELFWNYLTERDHIPQEWLR